MIIAIQEGEPKVYDFDNEDDNPKVVANKALQAWLDITKDQNHMDMFPDEEFPDEDASNWKIKWYDLQEKISS